MFIYIEREKERELGFMSTTHDKEVAVHYASAKKGGALYMYIYIYMQTYCICVYLYIYKESSTSCSQLTTRTGAFTMPARRKEVRYMCLHICRVHPIYSYIYIYICM